jgi:hypothetical protein
LALVKTLARKSSSQAALWLFIRCADAAFVVAEDHVHHPVKTVFHRPMAAHERRQLEAASRPSERQGASPNP